jgi:hypothetical protein
MSDRQNIAAWLPGVGSKLELGPGPMPEPGNDELLIQVGEDQEDAILATRLTNFISLD